MRIVSSCRAALIAALALSPLASADTLFVDANLALGANDGSSWSDAFQGADGLQAALGVAMSGDEIFVADGRYLASSTGNRGHAFALANGVTIYGSFAGGEASPEERPPFGTADSVLDGDLAGNDGSALFGDNSFHLITTVGTNSSAVIDGFVVRAGNADTSGSNRDRGAGILCLGNVSPTVRNCRFLANRCSFGGAAGYVNNGGAPTFTDCSFEDGNGGAFGGAFDIAGGGAVLFDRCLFRGNTAARAGALELFSSSGIVISSSVFVDNTATGTSGGGAIWLGSGGGARVRNCTIVSNSATSHANAGIRNQGVGNFRVFNSILWDNTGVGGLQNPENQVNAGTLVFNSLVQGGFTGSGNVEGDPDFADAAGLDFTPGVNSPVIDAGDNGQTYNGSDTDYLGNPRQADVLSVLDTGLGDAPIVDMGALEFPSAWLELGGALAGTLGEPNLLMTGTLAPGSANAAALSNAAPSSLSFLVAGFSLINTPIKGGLLQPAPDLFKSISTSAAGTLDLPFTWPTNLPSGLSTYYQVWVQDAGAPAGFASTNAVQGTTP
ncbi:MAG: hypothetical protein DHS20C15_30830 [Planctomycetota bacterium]|nr:MAG: hypothetical protein DHS20C15_30830 [Planctomycetota bacterium]